MQLNRLLLGFMLIAFTLAVKTILAQEKPISEEVINSKWRVSLNGGIGYRLANSKDSKEQLINQGYAPSEIDNYFKGIKWGPKISGQVHYLINPNYGVGIDYQFHHSAGSMKGIIDPGDAITLYYGKINDNVYTNYTGLSFYSNNWLITNLLKIYTQASIGISFFRQENISFYTPLLITGNALGLNLETGLEYFIHKNIALGIQLNYFSSTIKKFKLDNGISVTEIELDKDMYEGLGRLDAGFGIKFYF